MKQPARIPLLSVFLTFLLAAGAALPAQEVFTEEDYDQHSRRAAPRDAFPVLTDPEMVDAAAGDADLRADEPVIGVVIGGEAKAYPISVMGSHELANDHCGEIPVLVSW